MSSEFVPANVSGLNRRSAQEQRKGLNEYAVQQHAFALNTLTNPENHTNTLVMETASRRLVESLDRLFTKVDGNTKAPLSLFSDGIKTAARTMANRTTDEPGLSGMGRWFAEVSAHAPERYVERLGNLAVACIYDVETPHNNSLFDALHSFSKGFIAELSAMGPTPYALRAFEAMESYLRHEEHGLVAANPKFTDRKINPFSVNRKYMEACIHVAWTDAPEYVHNQLDQIQSDVEELAQERYPVDWITETDAEQTYMMSVLFDSVDRLKFQQKTK